jgi:hypothetical protein
MLRVKIQPSSKRKLLGASTPDLKQVDSTSVSQLIRSSLFDAREFVNG